MAVNNFHGILSQCSLMEEVFTSISRCAAADVPVFITGETGTGKELAARACHLESPRREQPFIAINCANLNENLMESQLFGHRRGAFTGATSDHAGALKSAGHGTLFLDEVTTLPMPLQAKLLRAVQEREFVPLGSHTPEKFEAQFVSASSTSLSEAVSRGEFREDLYYRLNVVMFDLPPLRKRAGDVEFLARHFLRAYSEAWNKDFVNFDEDALERMRDYPWPGNVRQLENILKGVIALNYGPVVTAAMLEGPMNEAMKYQQRPAAQLGMGASLANMQQRLRKNGRRRGDQEVQPLWWVERETIEHAIKLCGGNIIKAAGLLEVSPSTIYRKREKWLQQEEQ
ncbi:sigma 54-interacting transcriptional regulator [Biformimicrobium ophioploci]|uniref:Sigma-54 factor interaction domain-containing protein n=1 Tax=Biformimicrobium ophioploci TaxID=3036711 RepID=A0ABQ6LXJ6_9GAMM|nr:sigma-54 dependent transcriptional regulator [Microbulbifer sp. NKW57]GMG86822.1 hypothetical protein MNKW57_11430 [Microbulbifer sp. NKW57]